MHSSPSFAVLWLWICTASAAALPNVYGGTSKPYVCGQPNVVLTGLPPYHPLVIEQGYDPAAVEASLKEDGARIRSAGYNYRTVFFGPEKPISILYDRTTDMPFQVTGIGYGERGSADYNLTVQFTESVNMFKNVHTAAPMVFNRSPNTTLEALHRFAPITGDCSNSPGRDLGFEVYCDVPSVCAKL